jgi:hypothetical protein
MGSGKWIENRQGPMVRTLYAWVQSPNRHERYGDLDPAGRLILPELVLLFLSKFLARIMVPGVLLSRFRREDFQPSPDQAALSVLISSRTFRAYIKPHFPCLYQAALSVLISSRTFRA